MSDGLLKLLGDGLGLIVVPWCIFVTVSLFNQRQELALLRQTVEALELTIKDLRQWLQGDHKSPGNS